MSEATFALGARFGSLLGNVVGPPSRPDNAAILRLHEIQGNVLGGFNKDNQCFIGLSLESIPLFKKWLAGHIGEVATAEETLAFKTLFKKLAKRRRGLPSAIGAFWINIAFSDAGLRKLNMPLSSDGVFGSQLFEDTRVDVLLLLAADAKAQLDSERDRIVKSLLGVRVIHVDEGVVRDAPNANREHFGYRDGISQPLVRGIDDDKAQEMLSSAEIRSQSLAPRLIPPGEFVIGYDAASKDGERYPAGALTPEVQKLSIDGSFLVFWKLRQDIPAFERFLLSSAARLKTAVPGKDWTRDLVASLIMGRTFDGDDTNRSAVNTATGCPFAAHAQKAYPRISIEGLNPDRHRILRRGISYRGEKDGDKGLLFLCYQASIRRQFETIVQQWMGSDFFPSEGAGVDPFIGPIVAKALGKTSQIAIPLRQPNGGTKVVTLPIDEPFVVPQRGGYFFSPSITCLIAITGS